MSFPASDSPPLYRSGWGSWLTRLPCCPVYASAWGVAVRYVQTGSGKTHTMFGGHGGFGSGEHRVLCAASAVSLSDVRLYVGGGVWWYSLCRVRVWCLSTGCLHEDVASCVCGAGVQRTMALSHAPPSPCSKWWRCWRSVGTSFRLRSLYWSYTTSRLAHHQPRDPLKCTPLPPSTGPPLL